MERKAYLAAIGTMIIWSSAFTGITIALESFSSRHVVLIRFFVGSLMLALVALSQKWKLPSRAELPQILLLSLLGITTYHICLVVGQETVAPGPTSLFIATIPIWVAVLSRMVGKEDPGFRGWLAILCSFFGVALVVYSRFVDWQFSKGALFILTAAISTAIMFVYQRNIVLKYGSLWWTSVSIWLGTIPMLLFAPGLAEALSNASSRSLIALLYIGTVPILGYVTWAYALSRIPATATTSLLNIGPVFATIIAWWFLGEIPPLLGILGGLITIVGVFGLNFEMHRRRQRSN